MNVKIENRKKALHECILELNERVEDSRLEAEERANLELRLSNLNKIVSLLHKLNALIERDPSLKKEFDLNEK